MTDEDRADPRHLAEDGRQVLDPHRRLDHDDDEDLSVGCERPCVGACVVVVRAETEVAGGGTCARAPEAAWFRGRVGVRIPTSRHRGAGLFDGLHVRPHDPIRALVERLPCHPRIDLVAGGRDAHQRRDRRREGPPLPDLTAIEQELEELADSGGRVRLVLHLQDHTVVRPAARFDRVADPGRRERDERGIAPVERGHDPIQAVRLDLAQLSTWRLGQLRATSPWSGRSMNWW